MSSSNSVSGSDNNEIAFKKQSNIIEQRIRRVVTTAIVVIGVSLFFAGIAGTALTTTPLLVIVGGSLGVLALLFASYSHSIDYDGS